jgi:S-DNA-T family DNA segregation ATPase FtsK/SpoIIIE
MSMHTIRRYDSPFDRVSEAFGSFLKRRAVEAGGITLLVASIASALALASWSVNDPSWNNATSAPVKNLLRAPGAIAADLLMQVFGLGAIAVLLAPAAWGVRLLGRKSLDRPVLRILLWGAGTMACAATASALPPTARWPLLTGLGGVVGDGVLGATRAVLGLGGPAGAALAGLGFAALAMVLMGAACRGGRRTNANAEPAKGGRKAHEDDESPRDDEPSWAIISLGAVAHAAMSVKSAARRRVEAALEARREADQAPPERPALRTAQFTPAPKAGPSVQRREPSFGDTPSVQPARNRSPIRAADPAVDEDFDLQDDEPAPVAVERRPTRSAPVAAPAPEPAVEDDEDDEAFEPEPVRPARPAPAAAVPPRASAPARIAAPPAPVKQVGRPSAAYGGGAVEQDYELPPLPLLAEPKKQVSTVSKDALEQNATLLESTLEDFGVRGEIINVRPGPVVTLYELEPAPGTKSSRVISLADDIARSMPLSGVRGQSPSD